MTEAEASELEQMAAELVANGFESLKSEKWAPEEFARLTVRLMAQMSWQSLAEGKRYLSHFEREFPDEDFSEFDDMKAEEPGPYPLAVFVQALVRLARDSLLDGIDVEDGDGDAVRPLVEALVDAIRPRVVYAAGQFESFEEAQADVGHWDLRHTMHLTGDEEDDA